MANPTTILIVEDDQVAAQCLADSISAQTNFELLSVEVNLADGIRCVRDQQPDVVLIDLGLPDGSGLELISLIDKESLDSKSMVVSVFEDDQNIIQAINSGACGYILKDDSALEIVDAINIVLQGGAPISPIIAKHILDIFTRKDSTPKSDDAFKSLTDRETGILLGVCKGYTNKEIAAEEHISYHTVTTHIKHIYRKLKVKSRVEATHMALSAGFIDLPTKK